MHVETLE